jgi:hypothetical protein
MSAVSPSPAYHKDGPYDSYDAAPEYAQDCLTGPLCLPDLKPPYPGKELAIADYAHNGAMRRKQEVVEAHSRLWRLRVSVRILRLYGGRVEKRGRGDGVHAKAEDIECGEVYREAQRRLARVVRYRLWVEATRLQVV